MNLHRTSSTIRYSALAARSINRHNLLGNSVRSLSVKVNFNDSEASFRSKSIVELVRAYAVFKTCKIKFLVNNADRMIKSSYAILGEGITDAVLRRTFFGHFCAGQDTSDMGPTIKRLKAAGIGPILDYAAENDFDEEDVKPLSNAEQKIKTRVYDYRDEELCDQRAKIFESCVRSANALNFEKDVDGFAAIKITALGNPILLERMSNAIVEIRNLFLKFDIDGTGEVSKDEFKRQYEKYFTNNMNVEEVFKYINRDDDDTIDYVEWSNALTIEELHTMTSHCRARGPLADATLTEEEREILVVMRDRINRLAELASELNVKLMIDAEHTYFQPGIDNIAETLMRRYNKDRTVIFSTYQMYLTDSHRRLLDDAKRARQGGYHFACKLVRGAYMELERARAVEKHYPSPIHVSKQETHDNYNRAVSYLVDKIADGEKVEVMIASHNQQSIEMTLQKADQRGLQPSAPIYFGQLLGMADHLTYSLGGAGYRAYKYVPYGKIHEVMPYLIRRAQENSDMMGGVSVELNMLKKEIFRRMWPF